MSRTKIISVIALGTLVLAAIFGVSAYRIANAQTPSVTPGAPTTNDNEQGEVHKGMGGGANEQDLAAALGITVDQLNAARQKANDDALTQAVSQGLITQAQADDIKAGGKTFPMEGRWQAWLSSKGIDFNALLANALGITTDKLQAANLQAFNTKVDAEVTAGRLTQDQANLIKGERALHADKNFQSSMQSAYQAAVQQAVTSGVITQAEADQILKAKTGGWGGQGFGMPMFPGMMRRGFGGFEKRGGWGGEWGQGMQNGTPQAPVLPTPTGTSG